MSTATPHNSLLVKSHSVSASFHESAGKGDTLAVRRLLEKSPELLDSTDIVRMPIF